MVVLTSEVFQMHASDSVTCRFLCQYVLHPSVGCCCPFSLDSALAGFVVLFHQFHQAVSWSWESTSVLGGAEIAPRLEG